MERKGVVGEREIAIDTDACLNWRISPVEVNWVIGYKRHKNIADFLQSFTQFMFDENREFRLSILHHFVL